jgi:hypothetical protein
MFQYVFKISESDYLEATPIFDHPNKTHGLRIISISEDKSYYVFLEPVTVQELGIITSILRLELVRKIPM